MKRGHALKRHTPLRVNHSFRKGKSKTSYANRPRALDYMEWVRSRGCIVARMRDATAGWSGITKCGGRIEADHMGDRGLSNKAPDATTVGICTNHHRERTDFSGSFRGFKRQDMRAFVSVAIQWTQHDARAVGIEIPSC